MFLWIVISVVAYVVLIHTCAIKANVAVAFT